MQHTVTLKTWDEMVEEQEIDEHSNILCSSGIYFVNKMKHLAGTTVTITERKNDLFSTNDSKGKSWTITFEMITFSSAFKAGLISRMREALEQD